MAHNSSFVLEKKLLFYLFSYFRHVSCIFYFYVTILKKNSSLSVFNTFSFFLSIVHFYFLHFNPFFIFICFYSFSGFFRPGFLHTFLYMYFYLNLCYFKNFFFYSSPFFYLFSFTSNIYLVIEFVCVLKSKLTVFRRQSLLYLFIVRLGLHFLRVCFYYVCVSFSVAY